MSSEFDLIARIARQTGAARTDVPVGIGDDAAVVTPTAGNEIVLCTDTLVAGVHFHPGCDASSVGHKALAVNLSDLAAMGANPCWALLALTLPEADEAWVDGFVTGFAGLATRFGVKLVGGDTTAGPLTVTVQLAGQVPAGSALRRTGAQRGDALCISGTLGDAALALKLRGEGISPPAVLAQRLDRPEPRVALGLRLRGIAHAAIDVSDGLVADLGHLVRNSGLGADLDTTLLPKSPAFVDAGGTLDLQLQGGDDYELLFTVAEKDVKALESQGVTRIGTITASRIRCLDDRGQVIEGRWGGYDHFA